MTDAEKREKVIADLKLSHGSTLSGYSAHHYGGVIHGITSETLCDALALLKAQEPATVEPKRIELVDETKAWLDKMDAVDALGNIADICIDWDGYRTADGLGGLINEIWAYARYCADRLNKTLGAVEPVPSIDDDGDWLCGNCYQSVVGNEELDASGFVPVKFNFCPNCGRAVKWE